MLERTSLYSLRRARRSGGWRSSDPTAGFSLMELAVTLFVMAVVVLGALAFFDASARVSTTQVSISQIQATQRAVHHELSGKVSMAGVGGLSEGIAPQRVLDNGLGDFGVFPHGLALAVDNNVPGGTELGSGPDAVQVVPGTDVLTLRGVFSSPIYYIEPQLELDLEANGGRVTVEITTAVDMGITQDLDRLREMLEDAPSTREAVIVYDRYNPEYFAVLEYSPADSNLGDMGDGLVSLALSLGPGVRVNEFGRMTLGTSLIEGGGGAAWDLPSGITVQLPSRIGAIGILEEHRYYIREAHEIPGNPASRIVPALTRTRFYPGTDVVHPEGTLVLADNVMDLQIALGVDLPPKDGLIVEIGDNADDDEVLYNAFGDTDDLISPLASPWAALNASLLFVRFSTIVQADRPNRDSPETIVDVIEDHDYELMPSILNTGNYTRLRKRLLQTTVEVRNLP